MPETADQYQARLAQEWNQFVAVAPLYVDGVLAALPGAQIPASHPKLSDWLETKSVAKTTTKAAQAAVTGEGA